MNICVIGSQGFVGSAVAWKLHQKHQITVIPSSETSFQPKYFDLVINCAGNSKKYWAEKEPEKVLNQESFAFSRVREAYAYNAEMKLIQISSICAVGDTNYGRIKREVESWAINHVDDVCILRLGGLVGGGLIKNPIFDWLHNRSIRVSSDSIYNFISTKEVANIVDYVINNWESKEDNILNVAASESVSLREVFQLRDIKPVYKNGDLPCEVFDIDVYQLKEFYPQLRTSKEYVEEFLCSYLKT